MTFSRKSFLRTTFAAGLVALAVTGCGSMRPSEKIDIFEARLSASQEVPPNDSGATGMAEVMWNRTTNKISWKVSSTGLSGPATAAHIHGPAPAGQNAGVVIPFSGSLDTMITGEATLTTAQAADLASGLWYVNIHTSKNPGGEIRGQLRQRM